LGKNLAVISQTDTAETVFGGQIICAHWFVDLDKQNFLNQINLKSYSGDERNNNNLF
jgi:hypothetical protein